VSFEPWKNCCKLYITLVETSIRAMLGYFLYLLGDNTSNKSKPIIFLDF
jgi:hypothetical protein